MLTAADIDEEHRAAMASLTPVQRAAVAREAMANRLTWSRGGTRQERLQGVFEAEVRRRG